MRIMGLDLSMTASGIAFPDGSTSVVKPRGAGDERLLSLEDQFGAAVRLGRPDLVVIEDIQGEMKGAASKVVPMVHAVARLVMLHSRLPYALINPSTLKRFATGSHNADKTAMALTAFKRFGLEFADDNACDAYWIRAAGHAAYGEPLVDLPKAQTEALSVVLWPAVQGAGAPVAHLPKPARRRARAAA